MIKEQFLYRIDGKSKIVDIYNHPVRVGDILSSNISPPGSVSTGSYLYLLSKREDWYSFPHSGIFEIKCNIYFSPKKEVKKYLSLLKRQDLEFVKSFTEALKLKEIDSDQ